MDQKKEATRSDRINICAAKHDIYKQLTEGPSAPFHTMKDLFLTAATIGIKKRIRIPIEKPYGIFAWSVFNAQEDVPFLYALVLNLEEPLEIILDHGRMLDVLEEYANGGIGEFQGDLLSATSPSLMLANKILNEAL